MCVAAPSAATTFASQDDYSLRVYCQLKVAGSSTDSRPGRAQGAAEKLQQKVPLRLTWPVPGRRRHCHQGPWPGHVGWT